MKKLLAFLFLFSLTALAVTGNKVWRIPNSGSLGAWGPVNLADGTNAVTGLLAIGNLSTRSVVSGATAPGTQLAVVTGSSSGTSGTDCTSFFGSGTTCNFNSTSASRLAFIFDNAFASAPVCVSALQGGAGGCAINAVTTAHVFLDSACGSTATVICIGLK